MSLTGRMSAAPGMSELLGATERNHEEEERKMKLESAEIEEGEVLEDDELLDKDRTEEELSAKCSNDKLVEQDTNDEAKEFIEKKKQELAARVKSQLALYVADAPVENKHEGGSKSVSPHPANETVGKKIAKQVGQGAATRDRKQSSEKTFTNSDRKTGVSSFSTTTTSAYKKAPLLSTQKYYDDFDKHTDPEEAMISNWAKGSRSVANVNKYKTECRNSVPSPEPIELKRMRDEAEAIDSFEDYYGRTSPNMQANPSPQNAASANAQSSKRVLSDIVKRENVGLDQDYRLLQPDVDYRKKSHKQSTTRAGHLEGDQESNHSYVDQISPVSNEHGDIDERFHVANANATSDSATAEGNVEDRSRVPPAPASSSNASLLERHRKRHKSSESSHSCGSAASEGQRGEQFRRTERRGGNRGSKAVDRSADRDYRRSPSLADQQRDRSRRSDRSGQRATDTRNDGVSRQNARICKFHRDGFCREGSNCSFSHDLSPLKLLADKIPELCKYFATGHCRYGSRCPFFHQEFPCRFHHSGGCPNGPKCKFSHEPLNDVTRPIYEKLRQEEERSEYSSKANGPATDGFSSRRKCLLGAPPPSSHGMFSSGPAGPPMNMGGPGPGPMHGGGPMTGPSAFGGPPGPMCGPGPMGMPPVQMNIPPGGPRMFYDGPGLGPPPSIHDRPFEGPNSFQMTGPAASQMMPGMQMPPQNRPMTGPNNGPQPSFEMNQTPYPGNSMIMNSMQSVQGPNINQGPPPTSFAPAHPQMHQQAFNSYGNSLGPAQNYGPGPAPQQMMNQQMAYYGSNNPPHGPPAGGCQMLPPNSMCLQMQQPPSVAPQGIGPPLQQQCYDSMGADSQSNSLGFGLSEAEEQRRKEDLKYAANNDSYTSKSVEQQHVNDAVNETKPMSFSITDMLKQIRENVTRLDESYASPAFPSDAESSADLDGASASSKASLQMPQQQPPRRYGNRPSWRFVPVDVDVGDKDYSIPESVMQQLQDPKFRNDPRLSKRVINQFDAVSQIISSKTGKSAVLESPASPTPESQSGQSATQAALTTTAPRDPRAARDPRLATKAGAASGTAAEPLPQMAIIAQPVANSLAMPPRINNPPPMINYGPPCANAPPLAGLQPYMNAHVPPPLSAGLVPMGSTMMSMTPTVGPIGGPPPMMSAPGWMPQLNQNASAIGLATLPDIPLELCANPASLETHSDAYGHRFGAKERRAAGNAFVDADSKPFRSAATQAVASTRGGVPRDSSDATESPPHQASADSSPKPLSLREKRKDLQYESPLAAKMQKFSKEANEHPDAAKTVYSQLPPSVKVKKRSSANISDN